ncbi:hypothetical protein [Bacillus sp. R86525]|uniref:hypothetical protein n=1 Tax=Bacillus sp. R86525 TaxID=3101709 RepID=UPI00366AB47C
MTNTIKAVNEKTELKSIIKQLCREAYKLGAYPKESSDEVLLVGEIDNTVYLLTYYEEGCIILTSEADSEENFTITFPDGDTTESNLEEYVFPMQPLFYEVFYQQLFDVVDPAEYTDK